MVVYAIQRAKSIRKCEPASLRHQVSATVQRERERRQRRTAQCSPGNDLPNEFSKRGVRRPARITREACPSGAGRLRRGVR